MLVLRDQQGFFCPFMEWGGGCYVLFGGGELWFGRIIAGHGSGLREYGQEESAMDMAIRGDPHFF